MKEFTVILYAGGSSRLSLDLSVPKALLPIGNRPLIWYTLQLIQSHPPLASSPLLILISSHQRASIEDYLSTLNIAHEVIIHHSHHESNSDESQQTADELGTLDVIRLCYSRIRTESVCLFACDLFGRANLTSMINMFRVRDASLCILLLKTTPTPTGKDSLIQPGQKNKFRPELEFFILDESTSTVTSVKLEADLDGYLPLKQKILAKFPRTMIRTDLIDGHLYLIKKSCLDIAFRSNFSSFRKEFVPKMVRQLSMGESLEDLLQSSASRRQKIVRQKTTDFDDENDFPSILKKYDTDDGRTSDGCYYFIQESELFRVKHVLAYLEANRQASALIASYTNEDISYQDRMEQVQISSDCVIGDGCDVGKRSTVKRTIIGRHCRIEERCKLVNCVLLDNVIVKEGVTIQNSIISSRSIIGTKCEIHNSIVCSNQQIEANHKLNGETISSERDEAGTFILDEEDEQ